MSVSNLPVDSIICGDNCDVLGTFPRECIDLVVTSPPYDELRPYAGYKWDFYGVAWQLKRVLKPGGMVAWVIADQVIDGSESLSSVKQALHFRELGFRVHDTMIWNKQNSSMPDKTRYYQSWEYVFLFSLGVPAKVNLIRDKKNVQAGRVQRGTTKREGKDTKPMPDCVYAEYGVRYNVWDICPVKSDSDGRTQTAAFPPALAGDLVRSWSDEDDIVLDPFNGSGTTTKMARELGRHFIGIEINGAYCDLARRRLQQELFDFEPKGRK